MQNVPSFFHYAKKRKDKKLVSLILYWKITTDFHFSAEVLYCSDSLSLGLVDLIYTGN